jgi:hypothetical protein
VSARAWGSRPLLSARKKLKEVVMGKPIDPEMFHASSQADRDCVTAFFDGNPDLNITDTTVVQVVSGGLKVTELVRGEDGKVALNAKKDGALTRERLVKCSLPYEVSRCLHDMESRS